MFAIGVVLLTISSCNETPNSDDSLEYEVRILKSKVKRLQENYEKQRQENLELFSKIFDLEYKDESKGTATFCVADGISDGFQVLETTTGSFLILLKEITPYLSGYKLVFSIGNPSLAIYDDVNLKVKWNRSYESWKEDKEFAAKIVQYEKEYKEYLDLFLKDDSSDLKEPELPKRPFWSEESKEKGFALKARLNSGAWNTIEVHVTPATLEQLDYVKVQIEAPTIILNREKGQNS